MTHQRPSGPADAGSDAATGSDGDTSPEGDGVGKHRLPKTRPAFSVSAVAFTDDPADPRVDSAPSSPGSSSSLGFASFNGSLAGSSRSGDDAAETLSASMQSLSAPSHLSTESQTALAQDSGLPPALQNSLASLSRSPTSAGRPPPAAQLRASGGGLGVFSSPAGSPAPSQAGDEPHRDGAPEHEEEEEELSLAALPLKRPAPDRSSGSAEGTGEDSSEVTFGAGIGGDGGGAQSRLRVMPETVDDGTEVQSVPRPAQLPQAVPAQQVLAYHKLPSELAFCQKEEAAAWFLSQVL